MYFPGFCRCSVAQSCLTLCDPMDCSTPGSSVLHLLEFGQSYVHWVDDVIQPSLVNLMSIELMMSSNHLILCHPLLILPSIFPSMSLFQWIRSLHQLAKILELPQQSFPRVFRVDFLWDWLVWSPCCQRDSQESSLTPQFESINCSMLSLFYGPTLTSIHNYWKDHSFDYTDLGKVMFLLFSTLSRFVIAFQGAASFNFMAAITFHSDFRSQGNKVCHCFHCFPIYLPWSDGARCQDLSFLNVEF